jgi:nicotinate-nucleotide--dimethylbenzimidazole phosphoribosyltransferase
VACKAKFASLAKPVYGLGKIEDLFMQFAGIQQTADVHIQKKAVVIFCADHGVVKEGVSQTDHKATKAVADHLANGNALIQIMANRAGVDVVPVDIGVQEDTLLPDQKIRRGTANMLEEPAMTRSQAEEAVLLGIRTAWELKTQGYDLLAAGEMGIGNTTAASAITSVMLGLPADKVTWKGAGLTSEGWRRKLAVVEEAVQKHAPDKKDPLDVLSKVGGLEIAGMTGLYLGGAAFGMPVMIDGFASAAAAFLASKYTYLIRSYAFPSHMPKEPGAKLLLERMQMSPALDCQYNLGQGTGAVSLMPILDMVQEVYDKMETFEEFGIEPYQVMGCH